MVVESGSVLLLVIGAMLMQPDAKRANAESDATNFKPIDITPQAPLVSALVRGWAMPRCR